MTDHFLPPDPVPDPPHLAIAFDAIKRRDVFEICDQYPEDILSYGFFTNTDLQSAQLIAKTSDAYYKKKPSMLVINYKTKKTYFNYKFSLQK